MTAPRRGPLLLLLACLLYLGFRAAVLLAAFDAVALPMYELHNMGSLARLLALGAAHPPLAMHFDNAGGQQLVALLAAPLYALLGPSYLALKLVPLLLGLAALLLLWRFMRREFGLPAACVAAALYALGPPTLVKYSLIASGNHFENVVFVLALLELAADGHRRDRGRLHLAAQGALAGLALFVYPGAVVPVGLLALLHLLVRGPRRTLGDLPCAAAGLLLGLLPLLAANAASTGRTLQFAGRNFAEAGEPLPARFAANAGRILTELLPRAGCHEALGPVPGGLAEALSLLGFVAAWLLLLPGALAGLRGLRAAPARQARWRALHALPLLLFLPALVLLVSLGRWDFDAYAPPLQVGQFRYFVPHFVVAAMLAGAAVQRLADGGRAARLGALLLATALLLPCAFTLSVARAWPGAPDAGRAYAGYHFPSYARILVSRSPRDPATGALAPDWPELRRWLRDAPARDALAAWTGVGHAVTASLVPGPGAPADRVQATVDLARLLDGRAPPAPEAQLAPAPEVQLAVARGVGAALRPLARGDARARETLARLLLLLEQGRHPLAGWVAEGLCFEVEYPLVREADDQLLASLAALEQAGPRWSAAARHGYGAQLGRLLARGLPPDRQLVRAALARLPAGAARDVARGVGWGAVEAAGAGDLLPALQAALPEPLLEEACRGAGAARRWLDGAGVEAPDAPEPLRAAFLRGAAWPAFPAPWWDGDG